MKNFALITGASSGIGLATARILHQHNYELLLLARREDRLESIQEELNKKNPNTVHVSVCDIGNKEDVNRFVLKNSALLSQVNVLVNNAGLAKGAAHAQNAKWSDWEEMLQVNVQGLFHMTHQLLPFLLKQSASHIVNIGSVAGRLVYPGGAVYCASKFAVRAFSDGLRMDLAGKNVRITNIEPGMVNTEFSFVRFEDQKKAEQVYEGMTPLKDVDIAESILWSLQRPKHVNIQELVIYPTDQASVGQVYRRSSL